MSLTERNLCRHRGGDGDTSQVNDERINAPFPYRNGRPEITPPSADNQRCVPPGTPFFFRSFFMALSQTAILRNFSEDIDEVRLLTKHERSNVRSQFIVHWSTIFHCFENQPKTGSRKSLFDLNDARLMRYLWIQCMGTAL